MTKKERIQAAVAGERPDVWPFSFWTHLPGIDLDPAALADATYDFYRTYDVDVVKTMNNGMYAVEDFGCKVDYSEIVKGGVARITETPVTKGEDWYKLEPCSPEKGSLARELKSLKLLLDKLKNEDVPVIFTVFSPLTIANKISCNQLKTHLEAGHEKAVHSALEAITETTCALSRAALELGADGVFMAAQNSTYDYMTKEQYCEFGVPYDLRVLEAAKAGWMNTLHAHGVNIMFELLKDYPIDVFNWHAWETLPAVDEAAVLTEKCLMGGLKRSDITNKNRNEILHQTFQCYRLTGGIKHILTPGCVVRYPLDRDTLHFVKEARDLVEAAMKR